ncbi:ester cyclase (plasmid) [Streptomycetaceae bacterium NBC_01309]
MSTFSEEHLELLKRHQAAENAHDLEATLATLADDCVFHDLPSGRRWIGHEGATEYYQTWWKAFDHRVTSERLHFPAPHLAIAETRWAGQHVGEYWGIAPTGRPIDVPVVIFVEIRDGLMAGERFIWDRASLLTQLGAGPGIWGQA